MQRTQFFRTARVITRIILAVTALVVVGWALWRLDVEEFVDETAAAGPLPFFAALAVLPAIGFPTTPLFLLAGAAFGTVVGIVGTILSMTINLAMIYWLAGGYLRRMIETHLLVRFRYTLPDLSRVGAWRFTLLIKLAPGVPSFIKNYVAAIAGVPAKPYFGVLWPLTMLYAAAVILLGDSLHDGDHSMTVVAVASLIVLLIALKLLRPGRRGDRDDPLTPDAGSDDDAELDLPLTDDADDAPLPTADTADRPRRNDF